MNAEETPPTAEYDALEVRCPDCGVDASRLPPCRVCGYVNGCCPCYHADDADVSTSPGQSCDHDWSDRGSPGDYWQECWLCGVTRDLRLPPGRRSEGGGSA